MGYRFDDTVEIGGPERRQSSRLRALVAGFVASTDGSLISDCLIRDVGTAGVQIRANERAKIPANAYVTNLATRTVFQVQPVWRHGSLVGMAFDAIYIVGTSLPAHLCFIPGLCADAKHRRMSRLVALGVDKSEALLACGLAESPSEHRHA